MYPHKHFVASLPVAVASLLSSQGTPLLTIEVLGYNITVFCLCLLSGVLLDVDHLVDIGLNRMCLPESLKKRYMNGRLYVPFHGIENTIVLTALSIVYPFLVFPTISYAVHMTMDVAGNGLPPQAYLYAVRFHKILTRTHTLK